MQKAATFSILAAAALSLAGCRKSAAVEGHADAGDAGPSVKAIYTGPLEAHVVARASGRPPRLIELANGKVILDAGVYVFELTPDGRVVRLGDPASYVSQMPDGDDQLGGYGVAELVPYNRHIFGLKTGAVVIADAPHRWSWNGTTWTKEPDGLGWLAGDVRDPFDLRDVSEAYGRYPSDEWKSSVDLPPGFVPGVFRRAADGTGILLGYANDVEIQSPVSVVYPPGKRAGTVVRIDELTGNRAHCVPLPSWSAPLLKCFRFEVGVDFYRLEAGRWQKLRDVPQLKDAMTASDVTASTAVIVGPDGSMWVGPDKSSKVRRIGATGKVDDFAIPEVDSSITRASYIDYLEYVQTTGAPSNGLTQEPWEHVDIRQDKPGPLQRIFEILPRPDGEAWVVAIEKDQAALVAHLGRPSIAPPPELVKIGSDVDQRNEVRDTRGQKSWVSHCPLLFVTLAKQRADGSFSPESVWAREHDIGDVVRKSSGATKIGRPNAALVEGRVAGHRVVGVLLWRSDFSVREDLLEKAAHAVIDDGAKNGPPPDVSCSAPVLERASPIGDVVVSRARGD
jgi:hypothetical protein